MNRRSLLAAMFGLALAPAAAAQEKLPVVASFSILADMVRQIGGDRVAVTALVGPDGDAHVFQPSPADARTLTAAKMLVVNGLGFEGWMGRLVRASGFQGVTITASEGVKRREMAEEHEHGQGQSRGGRMQKGITRPPTVADPHAWQDLANGRLYAVNIAKGLAAADPAGAATYERNLAAYLARIDAMDRDVRVRIGTIAPDKRKVITSHDAFGYFGAAYGITFVAAVGISTEAEASAADVARIVRQMRREGVRAVFVENMTDARLIEQIAKEAGGAAGGTLYADALSPKDGPAPTYLGMFEHNVKVLVAGMAAN
ncbi:metal ABC transporter substrate-binding protein [Desertibaculum subflavum]|uniref:metal ABC transporter substrate-binding protein n=1 Tax=Desertibaculum subflavum TaxID=2268458 RepID=UPI000E676505